MHTPTPWRQVPGIPIILAGAGDKTTGTLAASTAAKELPFAEQKANAALIVRAVNAHADLVAALRGILANVNEEFVSDEATYFFAKARAALAKAGEQ